MSLDIPWEKLGIPPSLRAVVGPDAPREGRLAFVYGGEAEPDERAAALYVIATEGDPELRDAAVAAMPRIQGLPKAMSQRMHAKVLEFIAETVTDRATDQRILEIRNTNDRTAVLIAKRADAETAGLLAENHERLLITPAVGLALHGNLACPEHVLERVLAFLRMNESLPPLPATRGEAPPAPTFDLEAEIQAALEGRSSPMLEARKQLEMFDVDALQGPLQGFEFSFKDDDEFSMDLLEEGGRASSEDEKLSIEKKIAAMSTGKKIKLAFLGNKEVRGILIRDRSKMVAGAVVKSGRLTDSEVTAYAGNRNLHSDVLREMAMNKEWMRKYPVQVALVNNPRCPPSIGVGLVLRLQHKELVAVARNRNVSSVVFQLATKLLREKSSARK